MTDRKSGVTVCKATPCTHEYLSVRTTTAVSGSRIPRRNNKAGAISFETRIADEIIVVPRKDRNRTPFRLTKSLCGLYASALNFTNLHYVEGSRYRGINLR